MDQQQGTTISRTAQFERQSSSSSRKESTPHRSEVHIDSEKGGVPPDPFESSVHGREVHVAKQKQTQKEVKGQMEITRKITATETTEVEHKARTQERVVQGQVVSFIVYFKNSVKLIYKSIKTPKIHTKIDKFSKIRSKRLKPN